MIVDTSVIICILLDESERHAFEDCLFATERKLLSAGTWVELAAVAVRRKIGSAEQLRAILQLQHIEIAAMSAAQAEVAHTAYRRFGLGNGHRAKLNFGDCFTYALAKTTGEPLLFKGDDFNHTDLTLAPESSYPR